MLKSKNTVTRLQAAKSLLVLKNKNISGGFSRRSIKKQIFKEITYHKKISEALLSIQHHIKQKSLLDSAEINMVLQQEREKLIDFLKLDLDYSLQSVFRLLSMIYNQNDIETTYIGIKSEVKDARINSLEFLDNLLKHNIKETLMPIVENYVLQNNQVEVDISNVKFLAVKEYLALLIQFGSSEIRHLVIGIISFEKKKEYASMLLPFSKFENENVKNLAVNTYEILSK